MRTTGLCRMQRQRIYACFAKHPEAGFVVGDIDNIALDGSYLGSPRFPLLEGSVYEDVLKVNHVANSIAVMWRRSVFEQLGGFRPSCSPAEDIELLLRAARLFQTAHHRATVAQYRRYPNTLSRKGELMLPAIRRIMRLQNEVVKGNPVLLRARRRGYAYWRDYFGKETVKELFAHIIHGSPRGAAKCLSTLFRYVGGRLFIWPWKYRRKIGRMVDSWFRRLRKRGDRMTSLLRNHTALDTYFNQKAPPHVEKDHSGQQHQAAVCCS